MVGSKALKCWCHLFVRDWQLKTQRLLRVSVLFSAKHSHFKHSLLRFVRTKTTESFRQETCAPAQANSRANEQVSARSTCPLYLAIRRVTDNAAEAAEKVNYLSFRFIVFHADSIDVIKGKSHLSKPYVGCICVHERNFSSLSAF